MKSSAATSDVINVLVADSNRMQSQLLTGALRRHPEFHISACQMEAASILQAVTNRSPHVAVVALSPNAKASDAAPILRRFHLSHPEIAKVLLVDTSSRELVVSAFRSGLRGIFTITDSNLRLLCKCIVRVAAGQIWANTEQLNYVIDLVSEI